MMLLLHALLPLSLLFPAAPSSAAAIAAAPPPQIMGTQYAFPVTGPESPACLDGKAFTITYQLSASGSTKWSFSLPGGGCGSSGWIPVLSTTPAPDD